MRIVSQVGFAAGLTGLGLLSLIFRDFALAWQPVPAGVPWRAFLACLSGLILCAGGVGMFFRRTAVPATRLLTGFVLLWLILLQVPRVLANPTVAGVWLGFCENVLLVCGGWVLCRLVDEPGLAMGQERSPGRTESGRPWIFSDAGLRAARMVCGISLPIIGYSHFKYVDVTAGMVPAWLPARHGFAYLTGAGHIAAGLGLLLGIVPRLAAIMEAAMITAFVVLLHAPGVVTDPHSRLQWTMLCNATAYAASAWAIAASFAVAPVRRLVTAAVTPAA